MLEVLKFTFSSFWVFVGTVILLSIVTGSLAAIVSMLTGRKDRSSR